MIVRGRDFDEIYDLVGIRVLVDTVRDCYAVLGAIHARWNPMPGRFKDYIATPKFNLYQSLHTTVIGPQGKPVEIQIRTHKMHQRAEYGVAAHWKYKEQTQRRRHRAPGEISPQNDMAWLRQLLDWQGETADPGEFLDSLRFEIGAGGLRLHAEGRRSSRCPPAAPRSTSPTPCTPRSATAPWARRSTAGSCRSSRRSRTATSSRCSPRRPRRRAQRRTGSQFVKSPRARNKIRQWFTKERREEAIEQGKDAIARAMRKQNLPLQRLMSQESLPASPTDLRYEDVDGAVCRGRRGPRLDAARRREGRRVDGRRRRRHRGPRRGHVPTPAAQPRSPATPASSSSGRPDIWVKLAKCCTPVPGDPIVGFVTRGNGVSVHRADCTNVESADGRAGAAHRRRVGAELDERLPRAAPGRGARPHRLLCDVTRVLSDQHVNILSAIGARPRATASRSRASSSRWATRRTSTASSTPCADRRRLRRLPRQRRQVDDVAVASASTTSSGHFDPGGVLWLPPERVKCALDVLAPKGVGQPPNSATPARAWSSQT